MQNLFNLEARGMCAAIVQFGGPWTERCPKILSASDIWTQIQNNFVLI
jgi:hypothetical protein